MNKFAEGCFLDGIKEMCAAAHQTAVEKGWWDDPKRPGELIALIHSEVSEALEALRRDHPQWSTKIPLFLEVEEELADVLIRIFDMSQYKNYDIGGAVIAKMKYNEGRSHKHGGKKF